MTFANAAYEKIRDLLVSGELPPGCHLVTQQLSHRIGIGLTPVREAVTRLASEGLLQHTPGAGVFVRRPSMADILQLSELRGVLEPFAAQLAAEHRTDGDLHEMRALLDQEMVLIRMVAKTANGLATSEIAQRWCLIERQFHSRVLQTAGNPWLAKAAADVSLLAIIFSPERLDPAWLNVQNMLSSWRDHRRIVRLLKRRAGADAAELMRRHLAVSRENIGKLIGHFVSPQSPGGPRSMGVLQQGSQPLARRRGRPPGKGKKRSSKPLRSAKS
jgi:DNA-binding GntR family transcriptional regulator